MGAGVFPPPVCKIKKGCIFLAEQIKYKRVLLKLSGEALSRGGGGILNYETLKKSAKK